MKQVSEQSVREKCLEGKNQPMAKEPRVDKQQNGETEPTRTTALKQPGTDEAKQSRGGR